MTSQLGIGHVLTDGHDPVTCSQCAAEPKYCSRCGNEIKSQHLGAGFTLPGYARTEEQKLICYECCAIVELARMKETGRATLYLTNNDTEVGNWPGTFSLPVQQSRKGRHNIAGTRVDVWFTLNGEQWHGVQYGEWTQLVHCRRLKARKA